MTDDEASRFSRRMIDTWPSGPRAYVWKAIAEPLDVSIARDALRQLERTAERAPTPAAFHACYAEARRARQRTTVPLHCELCDGTGYEDASRVNLEGVVHSYSKPCRCSIGEQRRTAFARIVETNARR